MKGDYGTDCRQILFSALQAAMGTQLDNLKSQLNDKNEHLSIDGLERQLIAVEAFASVVNEHTRDLRTKIAREKNQLLPIHRLPSELFIHILMQTQETSKDLDTRTLVRWATVCSMWRHIIISTPTLWRRIDLADVKILDLALSRNGSIPLEVHWCGPILGDDDCTHRRPGAHALYQSLAPRCRALYIYAARGYNEYKEVLKFHGAYATKIDISSDALPEITLPEGPPLESLVLRHVEAQPASWSPPRLSGLQYLYMQMTRGFPTDAQFYRMLASSPCLSAMRLDTVYDLRGIDHQDLDPTTPPLSLPNLRHLHVDNVPTRLVRLIATKLQCPNCEYLQIWGLRGLDIVPDMSLLRSLDPASWASCQLDAYQDITISHRNDEAWWPTDFPTRARFNFDLLVKISAEDEDSRRDAVSALSILIPSVHRLRLSHRGPNLRDLVECSQTPWQAREVYLEGPNSFLVQAVRVLGEQRSQTTSEDISLPPSQLSHLSLYNRPLTCVFRGPEDPLKELVEAVVRLTWTHFFPTADAPDNERASRLQIEGIKGLIDELRTKALPPNVMLG